MKFIENHHWSFYFGKFCTCKIANSSLFPTLHRKTSLQIPILPVELGFENPSLRWKPEEDSKLIRPPPCSCSSQEPLLVNNALSGTSTTRRCQSILVDSTKQRCSYALFCVNRLQQDNFAWCSSILYFTGLSRYKFLPREGHGPFHWCTISPPPTYSTAPDGGEADDYLRSR